MSVGLKRDHDEKRLYRSKALAEEFGLDRNIIFALVRLDEDSYVGLSDAESGVFADELSKIGLPDAPIDLAAIRDGCPSVFKEFEQRIGLALTPMPGISVTNQHELLDVFKNSLEKVGPTETLEDPLAALTAVFRTQADFASIIREIYEGRCAVRKSSLVKGTTAGLEAAHIFPRSDSRNFLPSNGFLLSRDLHNAFDMGFWTLTAGLTVDVHSKVKDGELKKFAGVKIYLPPKHLAFKPYSGYVDWHRTNIFGSFQKLGGAL